MKPEGAISLHKLNNLVKGILDSSLADLYWIKAETSDVRINQNGHCYLEFIEKDSLGKNIIAKARAMIWANSFYLLKAFFEETTKQPFSSGIKVLVQVSVTFHELYGYSLTVHDIDPSYTLGDQAMQRAAIIKQLQEEGVLEMNQELDLPIPMNRIAIISSPTAAGYEDFCHQLMNNSSGYAFYLKLFPAIMQGDKAEQSIIEALEKIYAHQELFDAVAIIRGGGATSDLSCFDSYLLAANCAQFPLPIITGIGHERDETVLDVVAHTRAKTPTAVAEFIITQMMQTEDQLLNCQVSIVNITQKRMQEQVFLLNSFDMQSSFLMKNRIKHENFILDSIIKGLPETVVKKKKEQILFIDQLEEKFNANIQKHLTAKRDLLCNLEKMLQLVSPKNILQKGYSLTTKNGKIVKSIAELNSGDQLTNIFSDGEIQSTVN